MNPCQTLLAVAVIGLNLVAAKPALSSSNTLNCVITCRGDACEILSRKPELDGSTFSTLFRENRGVLGRMKDRYDGRTHESVFEALQRLQRAGQCAPPDPRKAWEGQCFIEGHASWLFGSPRYYVLLRGLTGESVVRLDSSWGRAYRHAKMLVGLGQCQQKFDDPLPSIREIYQNW